MRRWPKVFHITCTARILLLLCLCVCLYMMLLCGPRLWNAGPRVSFIHYTSTLMHSNFSRFSDGMCAIFAVFCIHKRTHTHTSHVFSNCIKLVGVNLFYFYNTYSYSNPGLTRRYNVFNVFVVYCTSSWAAAVAVARFHYARAHNRIYLPSFFAFAITALVSFPGRFCSLTF